MLSEEPAPYPRWTVPKAGGESKPKRCAAETGLNTLERLLVFQKVNRVWRPHLSVAERDLLFYLLDRTVSWGNDNCRMTVGQMAKGSKWAAGSGHSERNLFRTLKSLRERGLLSQSYNGRATTFVLNLNWEPPVEQDMSLSLPKRLKAPLEGMFRAPESADEISRLLDEENGNMAEKALPIWQNSSANMAEQHCQYGIPINSIPTTVENNDKNSGNTLPGVGADDQGSLPGMNYGVRTRPSAAEAIAAVKAKPKGKVARPIWTVWHDAWQAAFPNVPCTAWTKRDNGMVRRVLKRAEQTKIDPIAFIEFCVLHWRETIVREFAWMKQSPPPTYPQVGFLATDKFLEKFIDRYATSLTQKRLAFGLTEEADVERLRQTGMSYEEALIEIGKRKGVSAQRKEFDKSRRELALQAEANELGKRRIQQQQAAKAPAKPHRSLIRPTVNDYDDANYQPPDFSDMKWED